MKTDQLLDEIHDANLSYLVLAQHLIRRNDRPEALYRLDITAIPDALTTGQIVGQRSAP